MKTQTVKPTQEEKAAFLAQYYSQSVLKHQNSNKDQIEPLFGSDIDNSDEIEYLLITPLSDITDEDATWVSTKMRWSSPKAAAQTIVLLNLRMFPAEVIDYLRSKGYATDWQGYTVTQLQDFGWLKLRQKG